MGSSQAIAIGLVTCIIEMKSKKKLKHTKCHMPRGDAVHENAFNPLSCAVLYYVFYSMLILVYLRLSLWSDDKSNYFCSLSE